MRKLLILLIAFFTNGRAGIRSFGIQPAAYGHGAAGRPKRLDMSGRGLVRTPMGGMGYTDAYGNTIDDIVPEEKKVKRRPVKKNSRRQCAPCPILKIPGQSGRLIRGIFKMKMFWWLR